MSVWCCKDRGPVVLIVICMTTWLNQVRRERCHRRRTGMEEGKERRLTFGEGLRRPPAGLEFPWVVRDMFWLGVGIGQSGKTNGSRRGKRHHMGRRKAA
jgi:hypothetical protein